MTAVHRMNKVTQKARLLSGKKRFSNEIPLRYLSQSVLNLLGSIMQAKKEWLRQFDSQTFYQDVISSLQSVRSTTRPSCLQLLLH